MTMTTRQLVPMASVADVERSITFYAHLGFEVGNTFAPQDATKLSWAWLHSGDAQLMLSKASKPVPDQHSVLFYVYTDDVAAARESLAAADLNPGENHNAVLLTARRVSARGPRRLYPDDYPHVIAMHT